MGYIQELRKILGTRPIIMAGVSVVVINEKDEILLQKRTDTKDWGIIGGALELGESLEEAANRELYEEAGLRSQQLKFIDILSGADMYYQYPHGDEIYNLVTVYETRDYTGVLTINDDEGSDLSFFNLNNTAIVNELNEMTTTILRKTKYIK